MVGGIGMCYLQVWCRHGANYAWLVNSIFVPGLPNGLSGLISTFVDIYANKDGKYKCQVFPLLPSQARALPFAAFLL